MSYVLYSFLLFSAVLVNGRTARKTVFVSIPPQYATGIFSASVDCIAKTGVQPDVLQHLIDWGVEDNDQVKKFIYCFGTTSGFVDTRGHFKEDKMVNLVGNHSRKHQYADVLNECNKLVGKDEYETLYKVAVCFHDKTPILFKL